MFMDVFRHAFSISSVMLLAMGHYENQDAESPLKTKGPRHIPARTPARCAGMRADLF